MSMHKYFACELSNIGVIPLGRTGEHKATSISIDATEWRKEHPGGVLALLVRSPAGVTYPATVETDGNTLTWTLTADETSVAGSGELELILSDSGYVCKSARCPTQIEEALTQNSDAPPAGKPEWVSELIAAIPAIEGFPETAKQAEDIISEASTATEDAKAAAGNANREAGNANKAAEAANTAAENWDSSYAADSAKLGGKSPAEYASAAEVSQLKNDLDSIGLKMDLLWTNASPRSEFAEQNLFMDLSKYKAIVVDVCEYAGSGNNRYDDRYSGIFFKGIGGAITTYIFSEPITLSFVRKFYMLDDRIWISNSIDINLVNNLGAVPQRIYGVR